MATLRPLSSKEEIERRFFFSPGTNSMSPICRISPESYWKDVEPIPFTAYLASSPSSTCMDESLADRSVRVLR
jgi:hypothetical protein